ncbi:DNA-binding transcriptional regulator, IclR family [Lentibacillus persicus]|uniref:Glycerol operon regulatory protein n=1 Tax=Lentibacillus persicus TaxID=640948 RepID=A0A1I1ZBX5_9BACI|nr:IclR family transcriptional regulator [Lentibacillus persicus]SFE29334.1 DNA-binding transcriptional regulator, IclR family [Lentibacillus persicus]
MNQSVIKALKLLDHFSADTPELTLKEIADKSNLPKPTAYRLLSSLESSGLLTKTKENEHDSKYQLGLKLLELGQIVSDQLEIRHIALPFMQQLARDINEVIHLVIRDQDEAVYIEKVDSSRALTLNTRVGKSSPLYMGSGPKMLLAHMPRGRQEAILEDTSNKKKRLRELQTIYETSYAFSIGEQDPDTTGISFPIYDYSNQVVAALAVSGLSSHFEGENLQALKQKTKSTAETISKKLGFRESVY